MFSQLTSTTTEDIPTITSIDSKGHILESSFQSTLNEGTKLVQLLRYSPDGTQDSFVAECVSQKMDELFQLQKHIAGPHEEVVTQFESNGLEVTPSIVQGENDEAIESQEEEIGTKKEMNSGASKLTEESEEKRKTVAEVVKDEKLGIDNFQKLESSTDLVLTVN